MAIFEVFRSRDIMSNSQKQINENKKINVMVSGLPGNMATLFAKKALQQEDIYLIQSSLTGEGILSKLKDPFYKINSLSVRLYEPSMHQEILEACLHGLTLGEKFIIAEFTAPPVKGQPNPSNENAALFCSMKIPFVTGSTGVDIEAIKKMVIDSGNVAVYAPNMAVPIVILQDMMNYAAKKYPGALKGYVANLVESHQASKKDTSGTMKAVLKSIQDLGVEASETDIQMIRDPKVQEETTGVPKEFLEGHGYHWYTITSPDGTNWLEFAHCVNGREIYVGGTLAAIRFLHKKIQENVQGKLYSMIDVLSGQ